MFITMWGLDGVVWANLKRFTLKVRAELFFSWRKDFVLLFCEYEKEVVSKEKVIVWRWHQHGGRLPWKQQPLSHVAVVGLLPPLAGLLLL